MNDLSIKHNGETTYILGTISCGKTAELLKYLYSDFINMDNNKILYIDIKKESFNNIKYDLLNKKYTVNILDDNCFFVTDVNFVYCSLNSINNEKIIDLINLHQPESLYLDINGIIGKHSVDFIPEGIKTYITLYD